MASSSERREGKAPAPPPAVTTATVTTGKAKAKKKVRRMTQEEIDSYIRYKHVDIPLDIVPKVGKDWLARTNLQDLGGLPVPLDQIDDYVANSIRRVNRIQEDFLKERDEILNEYYAKGYVQREVTDDEADEQGGRRAPCPGGRRRFRQGVAKQASGGVRKLN